MAAKRGYTYPAPSSAQFNQQKILTDSQENGVKAIPVTDFFKNPTEKKNLIDSFGLSVVTKEGSSFVAEEFISYKKYGYKDFDKLSSSTTTVDCYYITEKPEDGLVKGIIFKVAKSGSFKIYKVSGVAGSKTETKTLLKTFSFASEDVGNIVKENLVISLEENEYIGIGGSIGFGYASGHKMYMVGGSSTNNYSLAYNLVGDSVSKFTDVEEQLSSIKENVANMQSATETAYVNYGGSSVAGSGLFLMYPNKSLYGSKAIVKMDSFNADNTRVYLFKKVGSTLTCLEKKVASSIVEFDLTKYEGDTFFIVGIGGGAFKYKFQENAGGYKMYQLSKTSMSVDETVSMPSANLNMTNNLSIDCLVEWEVKDIYKDVEEIKKVCPIVEQKQVLKVAKDGSGYFTTINAAFDYAKSYMSNEKRVSIIVYPGVYDEVVNVLGNKFVSLVGVNRNDCIIRDTSGIYNNCPLRIEGNSYVANLTLISNHSGNNSYIVDGELKVNPSYALHIDDRHSDNDEDYRCTIFNCRMYSENNPAVGIGLDRNQTVELIQCELETNISQEQIDATYSSEIWSWKPNGGALFYHALYPNQYPISGDDGYQKLVVKNCSIKSNINNTISGEGGGMDSQLELTLIGNSCYSSKNGKRWNKVSANTLNELSSGNNISSMNVE